LKTRMPEFPPRIISNTVKAIINTLFPDAVIQVIFIMSVVRISLVLAASARFSRYA